MGIFINDSKMDLHLIKQGYLVCNLELLLPKIYVGKSLF